MLYIYSKDYREAIIEHQAAQKASMKAMEINTDKPFTILIGKEKIEITNLAGIFSFAKTFAYANSNNENTAQTHHIEILKSLFAFLSNKVLEKTQNKLGVRKDISKIVSFESFEDLFRLLVDNVNINSIKTEKIELPIVLRAKSAPGADEEAQFNNYEVFLNSVVQDALKKKGVHKDILWTLKFLYDNISDGQLTVFFGTEYQENFKKATKEDYAYNILIDFIQDKENQVNIKVLNKSVEASDNLLVLLYVYKNIYDATLEVLSTLKVEGKETGEELNKQIKEKLSENVKYHLKKLLEYLVTDYLKKSYQATTKDSASSGLPPM